MLGGAEWRSSCSRMLDLLHWAADEIRRRGDHRPDARCVPEGALRAPFAATQLATLVRVALERAAAALLGGPAVPRVRQPRPAPMPVPPGDPESGVRPLPSPARWREETARMIDTLEERIRSRRQIAGTRTRRVSAVQQQRYEYQQQLDRCRRLERQLTDRTPPEVLDELRTMGRQVYGSAWPEELAYES